MGLSNIMTPCRTEKVDFSKKNKIKNKNLITKKTNRQEESPEETKKIKKQKQQQNHQKKQIDRKNHQKKQIKNKKKNKNKTCMFRRFCFLCVFFLFFCLFLGFGVLVVFVCPGFVFVLFFDFFLKPYILCVIGLIRLKIGYPKTHGLKPHFPYHKLPFLVVKIT